MRPLPDPGRSGPPMHKACSLKLIIDLKIVYKRILMDTLELTKEKKTKATNESISGSEAVLRAFVAEGVDIIFGYPGGAIMPIYDALYDYHDKLTHILVRHEQGAIHAAQGFARVSGRTGVVFATSGPGATNLVTGLADAMIEDRKSTRLNSSHSQISYAVFCLKK